MAKETPFQFDLGSMFQTTNDAMKSGMAFAADGPRQATDAWLRMYGEFLRFASHRFAAQAELCQALRNCEGAESIAKVESAFFSNAADEYNEEFERLATLAREPSTKEAATKKSGKIA